MPRNLSFANDSLRGGPIHRRQKVFANVLNFTYRGQQQFAAVPILQGAIGNFLVKNLG